jgi:hypothetical protein
LGIDIVGRVLMFKTHQSAIHFELAFIQHPLQHVRAKVGFAQWSRQQQKSRPARGGQISIRASGGEWP